jgi:hypothetical protein
MESIGYEKTLSINLTGGESKRTTGRFGR